MKKIFTILGIACAIASMNAQVTIAQVYVAGGNGGATYNRDYVVLFNKTSSAVDVSGWSLQYGSATSTAAWTGKVILPAGSSVAAYSYYLVGFGSGNVNVGAVLPVVVDFDGGIGGVNMGANGKVALMNNATTITGAAPTGAAPTGAIDFVGMGTANANESGANAPAGTTLNALFRSNGGCTDTNNNASDFVFAVAAPLNSASATNVCSSLAVLAVLDVKNVKGSFVKNSFVKNNEIAFGTNAKDVKVYNMYGGQVVKTASVKENGTLNVSELVKGNYIVTGTVNNEPVSQKILKD